MERPLGSRTERLGGACDRVLTALTELGLREAECRGLRWGKIDWEANRISVTHQLGRNGRGLSGLKTAKSARTVVLTSKLRTALIEHQLASQHTDGDDLVFYAWGRRGPDYATCRRVFQRSLTKAGIDHSGRRCSLHGLRHSFASRLVRSGTDIVAVSRLLGHAKVSMTLDTYSHYLPTPGDGDGLLDSIERGLATRGGAS